MRREHCNTEEELEWTKDVMNLFCSLSPLPKGSMKSGMRFNAITRLIIYITFILIFLRMKHWYYFAIAGAIVLLVIHMNNRATQKQEHFDFLTESTLKEPTTQNHMMMRPLNRIDNQSFKDEKAKMGLFYHNEKQATNVMQKGCPQYMNGKQLLRPTPHIPLGDFANQINSSDADNQVRLLPLMSANASNSYNHFFDRMSNTTKEPGFRDPQAGIQYYTPNVGVNRKSMIPPIIAPRIADMDYWGQQSSIPNKGGINKLHIEDVTTEDINTSDMAQLPTRYPKDTQGYDVSYPMALPVEYQNRVPNGVWDMNPVGQNVDIGYYPSSQDLYSSSTYQDFNHNWMPLYTQPNNFNIGPIVDKQQMVQNLNNISTQPLYKPWDQANTINPPTQYIGITEDQALAQMGGNPMCQTCAPPTTKKPSREGFDFVDTMSGQAVTQQLNGYLANPPPYPLPSNFNTMGGRGMFGGGYTEMNRVPPGQNAQIPPVTNQLMYQSPTYSYTEDYFNQPNNKLFLQSVQPSLYSYSVDQTPINSSIGISYAPQKPPRVLDQVTANGMSMPLYSSIDPQLIRTDGTPGQQASQPIRTDWSAEYSNFQPPAGSVNFEDIYDPRFNSYGDPYRSYSDINLGQVQYYYSDVDAYKIPNFISRSNVDYIDFRTPQGQIWPYYDRNASLDSVRPHVESQTTSDELYHREDLMSLQMDKRNREMWQLREAPLNNNNAFRGATAGAGI